MNTYEKLYHGSPTPLKQFDLRKGSGRFGAGLYLTPELEHANFYSKGGRQGNAGQKLNESSGHIYEFNVSGNFFVVEDMDQFLQDHVLEMDAAEETLNNWGELSRIEKHVSDWAKAEGYDGVDFTKVTSIPQIIVVNKNAIKSAKKAKDVVNSSLAKEELISKLNTFSEKYKVIFEFEVISSEKQVHLDKLHALVRGDGKKLMLELLTVLDSVGYTCWLNAIPLKGTSVMNQTQLISWYKQFGFKEDGIDPDSGAMVMYRHPLKNITTSKASVTQMRDILKEFKDRIFPDYDFPIPPVKVTTSRTRQALATAFASYAFDRKQNKVIFSNIHIQVSSQISESDDIVTIRRVLAHELIHIWEYHFHPSILQMKEARDLETASRIYREKTRDAHGETFQRWMNKFNSVYGKDFVVLEEKYAEDGNKFVKNEDAKKPFFILVGYDEVRKHYFYGVALTLKGKNGSNIARGISEKGMRLFTTKDERFFSKKSIGQGYTIHPKDAEAQKILKDMFENGKQETITSAAAICDERDFSQFVEEFALKFRQRASTLRKIFHNYEKDLKAEEIYRPVLTEMHRQVLKTFGNCDAIVQKDLESIFPKYVFSNQYKPQQAQYKKAIQNWFEYLREMFKGICRTYTWLDEKSILGVIQKMESEFPF